MAWLRPDRRLRAAAVIAARAVDWPRWQPAHAARTWTTDAAQQPTRRSRPRWPAGVRRPRSGASSADIAFDPADLAGSRFRVDRRDGVGRHRGTRSRDAALTGADFFAVESLAAGARSTPRVHGALGDGRFEALRHASRSATIAPRRSRCPSRFKPAADGRSADLAGGTTIRRLDFGVGQGEWQDTQWLGDKVRIEFDSSEPARPATPVERRPTAATILTPAAG